jgi:hypothetical protein
MDHVYKTRDYKVYNVAECLKEFADEILSKDLPKTLQDIQEKSKLSNDEFEKMKNEIQSIVVDYSENDYLAEVNSRLPHPFNYFSTEALELQTVKLIKDEKIKKKLDEKNHENRKRYCSKFVDWTKQEGRMVEPDLVPYTQALLTVR